MNRIDRLFKQKDKDILSVYFTAGYPHLSDTSEIIRSLEARGIDMVEIGVPFSDPMADGPVIQESSTRALNNGMTLNILLDQVSEARRDSRIPFVLMGYLNPMMQYGMERLFERCQEAGIDALIIPDLPFREYLEHYKTLCEKYSIPIIMLITPETSEERIRLIDENCGGFIYMVSSASTTGTRERFTAEQIGYFKNVASMNLRNRRLIGFGISNPETLATVSEYSNGAIVGSLFIRSLSGADSIDDAVKILLKQLGRS